MGDRGADFGERRRGQGTPRETGDSGCWFVASEPVERSGEDGEGVAHHGGVARVVQSADCQSEVIECRHGVAVLSLEAGQNEREICLVGAVAAVLSDHQAPAQGVQCVDGIGFAPGEAVSEQRVRGPLPRHHDR